MESTSLLRKTNKLRSLNDHPAVNVPSAHFLLEKLDYIHNNSYSGICKLVHNPKDYKHGSARNCLKKEKGETLKSVSHISTGGPGL